jgi:hypothetical protein
MPKKFKFFREIALFSQLISYLVQLFKVSVIVDFQNKLSRQIKNFNIYLTT